MVKLGLMQPYFFPYIGYFQLINTVDCFIIYDDVNFIKKGWINRNRIMSVGKVLPFSIPIQNVSQHILIKDTLIAQSEFAKWKKKFEDTLLHGYKKAPFYNVVKPIIADVINKPANTIAELAINSISAVCQYLEIETQVQISSSTYNNIGLKGQERIIDICQKEKASEYINMVGGASLYDADKFKANNIKLQFLESKTETYPQFATLFLPNLSIIDVMMCNEIMAIKSMLLHFDITNN